MRIAHVTDCYLPRLGGIELQVHDLAQRQVEAGHDVTVITSTGPADGVDPSGANVLRLGRSGRSSDSISYRCSRSGRHAAVDGGFDLVHVHASSFSPLAFLTGRETAARRIPTVATVHSLWARAAPLFGLADLATAWGDWPIAWSAVSDAAAMPLRRVLAGRAVVTVLPNGTDPALWQVDPVPRRPDLLRLVVVARLSARKRPLHLAHVLRAARARLARHQRLQVEIIGDGPRRGQLQRYLSRHGMQDWVTLSGRLGRAEIRAAFGRSDLFVSSAVLESFGIAALEARCAGLPIVARAGTGIRDFVTPGRNGWLVDSDRAMVDTIVSLARQPGRLDGVRAINTAGPPDQTWPTAMRICGDLYREAVARQARRPVLVSPPLDTSPSFALAPPRPDAPAMAPSLRRAATRRAGAGL